MKNKRIFSMLLLLLFNSVVLAQRSKETACFDNFEYNNSGRSNVNAYLLSMVNYYMYPNNLLGVSGDESAAIALLQNNDEFEIEFKDRMKHWFTTKKLPRVNMKINTSIKITKKKKIATKPIVSNEPVIEFFYENNGLGYDPEAMLISTNNYIILAWRGTDRVSSTTPIIGGSIFRKGEWFQTNFDFPLVNPPNDIRGRVHRGFNASIGYNNVLGKIARRLNQLDINNKKLWITGHSLGGAHAQLSAIYLKRQYQIQPFAVYAYASPGVGNEAFNQEIERVVPGSKLQRFRYINDPVPRVPTGMSAVGDYTRAGQMNYYASEQGKNYFYNEPYEAQFPGPFPCHHHPHWYARAAYFELVDKQPLLSEKLPNAPNMPSSGCTAIDQQMAEGRGNVIQSFFGIDQDIEPGNYHIINAKTGLYLSLNPSDFNGNGKPLRLNNYATDRRFKWKIEDIPQSPLGGYVITSRKVNKVIDADRGGVGEQNSMVQTWDRLSNWVPIRTHQEWEIERLNNGRFHIKNIKNTRFLLQANSSKRIVLDDNKGQSSEWYFVKIN
jgi:hypothetical protein